MHYHFTYVGTDLRQLVPSARHQHHTTRPRIWANVSHDVPVYSLSFHRVLIPAYPQTASSGWVGLGAWFCVQVVYPSKNGHPPTPWQLLWPGRTASCGNVSDQIQAAVNIPLLVELQQTSCTSPASPQTCQNNCITCQTCADFLALHKIM